MFFAFQRKKSSNYLGPEPEQLHQLTHHDATDLWSGTNFSQRDLTCYCLDDECNRQFELPYYIQNALSIRSQEIENPSPVTEEPQFTEAAESGSGRVTDGVSVTDDPRTEEYSDDEDLTTELAIVC